MTLFSKSQLIEELTFKVSYLNNDWSSILHSEKRRGLNKFYTNKMDKIFIVLVMINDYYTLGMSLSDIYSYT